MESALITMGTLFGQKSRTKHLKTIKFRQIRAVYDLLEVREELAAYLPADMRFTSPAQISKLFSFLLAETKEYFFTMHMDGKNRISCLDCVSVGSLNQSIVHPREVFKTALLSSAAAIVLVHNHPSGDPTCSREDREITRRLKEAGDLLGIRVLDHIIVGESYFSFVEQGLL